MIAGLLEIQLMANMARLSDDMRKAERVVGDSMTKVEKSVSSAKQAMSQLGMGLSLGLMIDEVRRTTDIFTKLDAQIKLSTKTQEGYDRALSDIKAISATSQTDIAATTMLYTRLTNVMEGTGVSQRKLADVTSTISFGLKAFGATAQEAASASLQISQAMGANRLGGEEFRAAMEAMPNVMKVLAESMGVPLGGLRKLSMDGKITAEEMVKAWGNPEIVAKFEKLAEKTQTITGAWTVARNELTLLTGEFFKATGFTEGTIGAFKALASAIAYTGKHIDDLVQVTIAWAVFAGTKFLYGIISAAAAQHALTAAHAEAIIVNVNMARSEVASAKAAQETAAARAWQTGITENLVKANVALTAANTRLAAAEALTDKGRAASAAAANAQIAASRTLGTTVRGVTSALGGLIAANAGTIALVALGAAAVAVKNHFESALDPVGKFQTSIKNMGLSALYSARQLELANIAAMKSSMFSKFNEQEILYAERRVRILDAQISKEKSLGETVVAQKPKIEAAAKVKRDALADTLNGIAEELAARNESTKRELSEVDKVVLKWQDGTRNKVATMKDGLAMQAAIAAAYRADQLKAEADSEKLSMNRQQELAKQNQTLTGITGETAGIAGQNALFGLTGDAKVQAELELAQQQEDARYTIAQEAQAREMLRMIEQNTWTQDTAIKQAAIMEALMQQHQARLTKIQNANLTERQKFERMTMMQQVDFISSALMQATAAGARENRTLFEINKAAGIANAIVSTYTGATKALELGPWGIPLAAVITAAGMANVAAIANTKFGGGAAGAAASPAAGVPSMANALPAATPAATPAAAVSTPQAAAPLPREVNIYMRGDAQLFDAKTIREHLIPALNDAVGDGVTINVRQI